MALIYAYAGMTKQNVKQRCDRYIQREGEFIQLENIMYDLRSDHPKMGAEKMYIKLSPEYMGRDRFYEFYRDKGFVIYQKRNFMRTTDSNGTIRFPNLVDGLKLTHANQVWVSDITYFEMGGRFYYITFIMDLYSRYIVGHSVSKRLLTTQTTIPALREALKQYKGDAKIILHSDGGGQYYSHEFLQLSQKRIINSMALEVYENAHAERVNGIIKNEYVSPWNPTTFPGLLKSVDKAVHNYNYCRPHRSLSFSTPAEVYNGFQQNSKFSTKEKRSKKEKLTFKTTT